jgi:hypothetical protein
MLLQLSNHQQRFYYCRGSEVIVEFGEGSEMTIPRSLNKSGV